MATTASNTPALEISHLQAWYGESHVLHGVDIVVQPGEVVTLLGATAPGAPPPCAPSWA
jgi:branched-chain amino acid transport system ATP-binding protein